MAMQTHCNHDEYHLPGGGLRWTPPHLIGDLTIAQEQSAREAWQAKVRQHRDRGCAVTSPEPRLSSCPL